MSRDFYFYKVKAFENDVPAVIRHGSKFLDENNLYDVSIDRAEPWMFDIGKKTVIEFVREDLMQLSLDKFGCKYSWAKYLMDVGYEMHSEDNLLGIVPFEEIKKYEKIDSYEAVVFHRELIANPDDNYLLYDMEDKLYTEEELYTYADKIEDEYGAEYHYEALYILYKCARLARQGNLIWCEVC